LGVKSGKMGSIGMGVYTGMGRRQNRWIPIHTYFRTSEIESILNLWSEPPPQKLAASLRATTSLVIINNQALVDPLGL